MSNSANIRDVLSCFSPSFDFFASTSGDGRIKVWDTIKGQLQTEFSEIVSNDGTNSFGKPEQRGHLSIDYTCMKWVSVQKKKKRKLGTSLLVLGTGSGDVFALDVSAGELKWKISDCHPGGVCAISFSIQRSYIYTSGADGMVCEIDVMTGNLLRTFKASAKAVSSMCVSSDGRILATAAAQMKIFNCSDLKKIQKFTGHPGAVRCMTLSEDGKYVLSSAVGERYVAVWCADGSKKHSASCVLAMEHPSVYLDCRYIDNGSDGSGFYILAISETGICFFWYGKDIEELRKTKPTKISLSVGDNYMKAPRGASPVIFAARIQNMVKAGSVNMFIAHGFLIKPSFEKIVVHHGEDLRVTISREGLLLPLSQFRETKKHLELQTGATTALDRSNAEGALFPVPKVLDHDSKKQDQYFKLNGTPAVSIDSKDGFDLTGADSTACPMEDRLKSLGIFSHADMSAIKSMRTSGVLKGIDLEAVIPQKEMAATVSRMNPNDAFKALNILVDMWQSRSCNGKYVLPWITCILVRHGPTMMSQEPDDPTICSLYKIAKARGSVTHSLLCLSGRLRLITAQFEEAASLNSQPFFHDGEVPEDEDEDEDDGVEEVLYGEEGDESESSEENDD